MGFTRNFAYRIEFRASCILTHWEWRVRGTCRAKGFGRPTDKNLAKFLHKFGKTQPDAHIYGAKIVRQSDNAEMARYEA